MSRRFKNYVKILIGILLEVCINSCISSSINFEIDEDDHVLNTQSEYFIVLGDIQEYTCRTDWLSYYVGTMNWIWSQYQQGQSVKCILQVGDVTYENAVSQWKNYYNPTIKIAEKIPYLTCTGNHDYSWDEKSKINDRRSTLINSYAAFPSTVKNIVAYYEEEKIENIVVKNEIFGKRYDILVLEFGPRTEVVEWANNYVSSHPERRYILMTHEFLTRDGERVSSNSYAEAQIRNSTWSSPEDIWQKLVKENDNIVCVLCGHNGFSVQLFSENMSGRRVPQILFNLQYQENGGDGWIQLWEFPKQSDSVSVSVYNTIKKEFHSDPSTSFKFRYKY